MPTQNRSARGKKIMEWSKNESVANHSAMGWAESTKWVSKPGDSPRKGEGWCPKENVNEEHR